MRPPETALKPSGTPETAPETRFSGATLSLPKTALKSSDTSCSAPNTPEKRMSPLKLPWSLLVPLL